MNRKPASASRKLIDRLVPDERWGALHGFLATTYELQPDFLETDFLPSIFGLGAWDDRSWASRIAIEKQLAQLEAATVFMEARKYRGRPRSLRLEVVPVAGDRKLHAKVLLLVHEKAVRLLVASANLTDPGYRRNREVAAVLSADAKDGAAGRRRTGAATRQASYRERLPSAATGASATRKLQRRRCASAL
jgi:phosphatidylserine/phosphatidylglycerophosphate/cardiolipin synthase-like enzyme